MTFNNQSNPAIENADIQLRDLEDMQRATLNILEDFDSEKCNLELFQKASFNILEDLSEEKIFLEEMQSATLNILEDFNGEKERMEDTQKATLNILEDFNIEKEKATVAYKELKREVKAREEAEKFRFNLASIVDCADDAIFSQNLDGTISSWNNGAKKLYGYSTEEAIGQHIAFILGEGHLNKTTKIFEHLLKHQRVEHYETERIDKDGNVISISLTHSPINDGAGKTIGVSTIARDISDRKQAEKNLRKAKEELEDRVKERTQDLENEREALAKSNKDLEEFAYIASHDLKTPLRNIQSLSRWIEEDLGDLIPAQSKEYMGLLKGRVKQLDSLLDDLLAYSRAGRKKEDVSLVDTHKLINDIVLLFENEDLTLKIKLDEKLPIFRTQKAALDLVFRNLINNAIKHHDLKIISLTFSCQESEAFYTFSVSDDGPGIPSEYHERIFGMFKTLKPRDEVEGSGMGLALIKRIIESQRGKVRVLSSDGKRGTTMSFDIRKEVIQSETEMW